jgi:hypothetical protein
MLLNRTNLTLSALALSNGLNLGTRSLAANASVNDGDQTPRIRHSHHDVMRERMVWYVVSSIPKPKDAIPSIPSSFSQQQHQPLSCVTLPQGNVAVEVCVEPEPRPADLVGRPEPCVLDRDPSIGTIVPSTGNLTRGASDFTSRPGLKSSGIFGLKRTAWRAARPAAAAMSAAFGK